MDSLKKFENWKEFGCRKTSVASNWAAEDIDFQWKHTVQTNEVPKNDVWDSYSTDQKYLLADLHKSWSIPDSATEHYMSFSPALSDKFLTILEPFKEYNHSYNLLKLTPGHMLAWHFDTYATFIRRKTIPQQDTEKIKRSVILLTDWDCGHVIQIGNQILSHWSKGDIFTWDSYTWHGACNFGKRDMILSQVSYIVD